MKLIPQIDLKAIYQDNKAEIDRVVEQVLESGWYILGQHVENFERKFSEWNQIPHTITVANGTDAIELSLRACGVAADDWVATVSHTAVATISAIERIGAIPIFVDIDARTMTMCPNKLKSVLVKIKQKNHFVKAVVPVHIYGHMADMPAIMNLSSQYDFYVIEDCAQAHGAKLNDLMAGSYGHLAAFSFYPTKNLGAFGDGGAITTKDFMLVDKIKQLKQYGWRERNNSMISGVNSRLDEIQAAILSVLLKKLDNYNLKRQNIANQYANSQNPEIIYPYQAPKASHVFHQYVIRTKHRQHLQQYLNAQKIQTSVHYPIPVHLQTAYQNKYPQLMPLTLTERYASEILSLPINPYLLSSEVERICSALKSWRPHASM